MSNQVKQQLLSLLEEVNNSRSVIDPYDMDKRITMLTQVVERLVKIVYEQSSKE